MRDGEASPPWMFCGDSGDDGPEYDDRNFDYDEPDEPVGSCEWCGSNLYPWNDPDLCDSCAWHAEQNRGGDPGIQPVT